MNKAQMNKAQWIQEGYLREKALRAIAGKLGKGHAVTEMMGGLAWGRHAWEMGPRSTLQGAIILAAAMEGIYHTINLWARDNDRKAQDIIIKTYYARHEGEGEVR